MGEGGAEASSEATLNVVAAPACGTLSACPSRAPEMKVTAEKARIKVMNSLLM